MFPEDIADIIMYNFYEREGKNVDLQSDQNIVLFAFFGIGPRLGNQIAPAGTETLLRLCVCFYSEIVQLLIKEPRFTGNDGLLPLVCANGHLSLVRIMIKDGRFGHSIHHDSINNASTYGYVDIVRFLLTDERVDPSNGINHPIALSTEHGHLDVLKVLLKDPRTDTHHGDGHTSVEIAVNSKQWHIARYLIDYLEQKSKKSNS